MLDWGLPATKPGVAVDMKELDRVIDYPARDMTITVQAGITIAKLARSTSRGRSTVAGGRSAARPRNAGGAIATNASGPRRFGYGTLRDYVIGITVINDRGEEIKGGGRVVKNVAGYDLMKLYTGSFGTLGIIAQVTLKLKPLPESAIALVVDCAADTLDHVVNNVLPKTRTRPTAISIANAAASAALKLTTSNYSVMIVFEEKALTVDWQREQLLDELKQSPRVIPGKHTAKLIQDLADFPLQQSVGITFKANMRPNATVDFIRRADAMSSRPGLVAHAGNGIVFGQLAADNVEQALQSLQQLLHLAVKAMAI